MARDATATKERILQAAIDEFADRGFAGARVDDIATRAGVNKALLYQHFGCKEELYRLVLERKMCEIGRLEPDPQHLPELVGDFFDFHAANGWLARLTQWEALDFGSGEVPDEPARRELLARNVAAIEAAQRDGVVDPALDSRQTLMTLMGLTLFYFTAPQMARLIGLGDAESKAAVRKRREHVVAIARKILAP